jgi:hypothetical protein
MASGKIYEGTIGLPISIDMGETLTGATDLKLYIQKGNAALTEWTPSISALTKLLYTTQAGDLVVGDTIIHPYFTLGGWSGLCDPVTLKIHAKFS